MPVQQMQTQETSYKPWGLTAGAMVGQQQYDQEAANQLALQESQLGNVIKGVEAGRAQADFENPQMEQWRQKGIMGKDMTSAATGEYDQKVLNSKIQKGIAENIKGKSAAEVENQINNVTLASNNLKKIIHAGDSMGWDGLEFQTQAQAIAQEAGFSPEVLSKFMRMPPEKRGEYLKGQVQLMDLLRTNTNAVLQENAKVTHAEQAKLPGTAMTVAGQDRTTAANNANRVQVEQMGIKAGKYKRGNSGVSITTVYSKMKPPERLGAVQRVLTTGIDPETNEPLTEMARAGYEAMYQQDKRTVDASNAARNAGKIDVPAVASIPEVVTPSVGTGTTKELTKNGVRTTKSGNTAREVK